MINELIRSQLVDLGTYAAANGIFRGSSELNSGLAMVALMMLALFLGTLSGARVIAPGHSGEAALLTVMWSVLAESFLVARTLGHLEGPGPVAALGTFVLGLMLSATHFVLKTSWPISLTLIGICGALGGLFGAVLTEAAKLINAF